MNCSDKMGQNGLDQNKFLKKKKKPFLKKKNKTKKKTDFKIYPTYTVPSDTHTHKVPSPSYWSTIPRIFIFHFTYWTLCRLLKREGNPPKKLIRVIGGRIYYNFLTKQNILKTRQMQQDFCPVQSSRRLFLCIHINSSSLETWKNQTEKRKFESFDRQISQLHAHCAEIWQRKSAGI